MPQLRNYLGVRTTTGFEDVSIEEEEEPIIEKTNVQVAEKYDLVVIGSGPAGQKAAIYASKHGKKAAIIDAGHMFGGVCVNTGTIPSKSLREGN